MTEDSKNVLFRIGERDIVENGLYVLVGPSTSRHIAVKYDPNRNLSTWLSPANDGLMALVLNNGQLIDAFDNDEPLIYFGGGQIGFDFNYQATLEQKKILDHWDEELEKAGIGGYKAPDLKLKEQYS